MRTSDWSSDVCSSDLNLEAVLKEYAPTRLGMYEAPNGVIFSDVLEHFGYILNRVDEPVPVLKAPIGRYMPVSRLMISDKTSDFILTTPTGENHCRSEGRRVGKACVRTFSYQKIRPHK